MVRTLRSLLVERSPVKSAILPVIRPLGDVDEDANLFDFGSEAPLDLLPPINATERLLLLATESQIDDSLVHQALPYLAISTDVFQSAGVAGPLAERVQAFERATILAELRRNHFHITNTAKALSLERSHLYKKAHQLGIDLASVRHVE